MQCRGDLLIYRYCHPEALGKTVFYAQKDFRATKGTKGEVHRRREIHPTPNLATSCCFIEPKEAWPHRNPILRLYVDLGIPNRRANYIVPSQVRTEFCRQNRSCPSDGTSIAGNCLGRLEPTVLAASPPTWDECTVSESRWNSDSSIG